MRMSWAWWSYKPSESSAVVGRVHAPSLWKALRGTRPFRVKNTGLVVLDRVLWAVWLCKPLGETIGKVVFVWFLFVIDSLLRWPFSSDRERLGIFLAAMKLFIVALYFIVPLSLIDMMPLLLFRGFSPDVVAEIFVDRVPWWLWRDTYPWSDFRVNSACLTDFLVFRGEAFEILFGD